MYLFIYIYIYTYIYTYTYIYIYMFTYMSRGVCTKSLRLGAPMDAEERVCPKGTRDRHEIPRPSRTYR